MQYHVMQFIPPEIKKDDKPAPKLAPVNAILCLSPDRRRAQFHTLMSLLTRICANV